MPDRTSAEKTFLQDKSHFCIQANFRILPKINKNEHKIQYKSVLYFLIIKKEHY